MSNAKKPAAKKGKWVYEATAYRGGRAAGHVCYATTKDDARSKASRCQLPVRIKRRQMSAEMIASLAALRKI